MEDKDFSRRRDRRPLREAYDVNVIPTPPNRPNLDSKSYSAKVSQCLAFVGRGVRDKASVCRAGGTEDATDAGLRAGQQRASSPRRMNRTACENTEQVVTSLPSKSAAEVERLPLPQFCLQHDVRARRALRQRRPLESGELDPIYPVIPFFKAGTLVSDPSASYVKSDVGPKKATTDTTDHATPPRPQANPRRWKCSTCLALNGPGLNCKGGPRVCCVCGTERPRGITRGEDLSTASYISHSLRTAGLDNAKRSSRTSLKLVAPCKKVASARSIDDRGSKAGGAGQGQGRARVWSWLWPGRKRGCEDGKWRLDAGKAVADAVETPGVTGDDKNKSSKRGASTYKPPTTTADFRPSAKDGEVLPPVVAQGRSRSAGQETSAAAVVERESPPGKDNDDARTEHRDEQPVGIDVPPAVRDMPGFEDHPLCWEEDGAWFFRSKTS